MSGWGSGPPWWGTDSPGRPRMSVARAGQGYPSWGCVLSLTSQKGIPIEVTSWMSCLPQGSASHRDTFSCFTLGANNVHPCGGIFVYAAAAAEKGDSYRDTFLRFALGAHQVHPCGCIFVYVAPAAQRGVSYRDTLLRFKLGEPKKNSHRGAFLHVVLAAKKSDS